MLVDGDHSRAGVRTDLNNVLKFKPRFPTVIMAHDSFNPACRTGMLEARWTDSAYAHLVEIDFQHGSIFDRSQPPGQMWGGFALAVLLPEKRQKELIISERHQKLFRIVRAKSWHAKQSSIWHQALRASMKLQGLLRAALEGTPEKSGSRLSRLESATRLIERCARIRHRQHR